MHRVGVPVSLLVEGPTDEQVIRRLFVWLGLECGPAYGKKGKDHLLRVLPNYNQAAHFSPWLAVVDLNHSAECAPPFVRDHLPVPAPWMCFRVAVRTAESWLLADAEQTSKFLQVSLALVPTNPDALPDAKEALVKLARSSRSAVVRRDMVPREGSGGRVGPGYTGRLIEFAKTWWRPEVAVRHSESLRRCVGALDRLGAQWIEWQT